MPQSGAGSMQGSNEYCLPMKGHTRGGDAPTMLPIERTDRGQRGGRTHNVTQHTDTQFFFGRNKLTHKAIY